MRGKEAQITVASLEGGKYGHITKKNDQHKPAAGQSAAFLQRFDCKGSIKLQTTYCTIRPTAEYLKI